MERLLHCKEKVERGHGRGKLGMSSNIRCLLTTGMSPADSELIFLSIFHRKTHAECAVEDDAEDAKGIPKKLTP